MALYIYGVIYGLPPASITWPWGSHSSALRLRAVHRLHAVHHPKGVSIKAPSPVTTT